MKILVAEEQEDIRKEIVEYLSSKHMLCEWAGSFHCAKNKLSTFDYHVVILDREFLGGNVRELISLLKASNPNTAILIIASKDSLEEKVMLLELGADDYLSAPFHMTELSARILALYRRTHFEGDKYIIFKELSINLATQEVCVDSERLKLTAKEYELLLLFLSNKNRVLGKHTIAEYLWGDYVDSLDHFNFIYQHIKNLRKKLKDTGAKDYIQNVYGLGYKFNTWIV